METSIFRLKKTEIFVAISGELVLWSVCLQAGWSDIWILQDFSGKVSNAFICIYFLTWYDTVTEMMDVKHVLILSIFVFDPNPFGLTLTLGTWAVLKRNGSLTKPITGQFHSKIYSPVPHASQNMNRERTKESKTFTCFIKFNFTPFLHEPRKRRKKRT